MKRDSGYSLSFLSKFQFIDVNRISSNIVGKVGKDIPVGSSSPTYVCMFVLVMYVNSFDIPVCCLSK